MPFDLNKVNQSRFITLKFMDNSVYYGEIDFFDETGDSVKQPEDPELIETGKVKRLRHGNGAQIFFRNDNTVLCKYEGEWVKDQKTGEGFTLYPDQGYYIGSFIFVNEKLKIFKALQSMKKKKVMVNMYGSLVTLTVEIGKTIVWMALECLFNLIRIDLKALSKITITIWVAINM